MDASRPNSGSNSISSNQQSTPTPIPGGSPIPKVQGIVAPIPQVQRELKGVGTPSPAPQIDAFVQKVCNLREMISSSATPSLDDEKVKKEIEAIKQNLADFDITDSEEPEGFRPIFDNFPSLRSAAEAFTRTFQTPADLRDACEELIDLFNEMPELSSSIGDSSQNQAVPMFPVYVLNSFNYSNGKKEAAESPKIVKHGEGQRELVQTFKREYKQAEHCSFHLQTSMGEGYFEELGVSEDGFLIGVGATSRVFKGEINGKPLAIKILHPIESRRIVITQEDIDKEVEILLEVRPCPYAVGALEVGRIDDLTVIVMEQVKGIDLFEKGLCNLSFLDNPRSEGLQFSLSERATSLVDIASGLNWLHSRGIIHRDIKLENVMGDNEGHAKIIDFGFARRVSDGESRCQGSPFYISPEVYQREIQKSPADIYSIGVLIDTLLRGKGSYITSDPQDEHKINPNILKTSISVRPERYKDILVCIWKEVVLPILEKHFGYIKGDASNKNIEISRLLQLMMGRFLYGGFEVLITDLLKKAPPKDPDLLLKVQSMKEGSVIWSSILKIKTDVFKIQEQAATIVGKCLRCDPESRISTPDLANNLSELQGRILDLKREAIEILRLGDEK